MSWHVVVDPTERGKYAIQRTVEYEPGKFANEWVAKELTLLHANEIADLHNTNPNKENVAPWFAEGERLDNTEGMYSYFVAWEKWLAAEKKKLPPSMQDILENLNSIDNVSLYCIFNACVEQTKSGTP